MRTKHTSCDAIVIGGGESGLLCAAYLAKSGAKTVLLGQQKQWDVAGNLLTEEFQGPYRFDMVAPNMLMMTDGAPCYDDLELDQQSLQYVTPAVQMAFHHGDGKALVLHRDPARTAASIARFHAADGERFETMYAEFKALSEQILIPSLYVAEGDQAVAARLDDTELGHRLAELSALSPAQIIDSYGFESPPVREAMLYLATYWGLDPDETGVGQVVPLWVYRLLNAAIVKGGNHSAARALYQTFLEHGGDYPGDLKIRRILLEDGKAVGVELLDGSTIRARAVVSTMNVEQTFVELVGENRLSGELAEACNAWEWEESSLLSCHYGYRGEAPSYHAAAYDPDVAEAFIHIFGIERAGDVEDVYRKVLTGSIPHGHGRALCATQFDEFHAGYDQVYGPLQTLRYEMPAPGWLFKAEWTEVRTTVQQACLETWRRYADNVVDGTLSYGGVLTPHDLEQRLPTFKQGSFKGGKYTPDRIGYQGTRPVCARIRSEIDGLYMGGDSTHTGGLIYFAAGYNAARTVAADLGLAAGWSEPDLVRAARDSGYLA